MANKGFRKRMRKTESDIKSFEGSHLTFDAQEEIEKMTPSKAAEVLDAKETINNIKLKFKKAKKLSSEDINFLTTYYAENP